MPKRKSPTLHFTVSPALKHLIWEEADRLKMSPSRWVRETLQVGLLSSSLEDAPDEYVINLTIQQHRELRKAGIRVSCKPLD